MNLFKEILEAEKQLQLVVQKTPLLENLNLSEEYNATILLKREDLQVVRSYKIRGAYNKMASLTEMQRSAQETSLSMMYFSRVKELQIWRSIPLRLERRISCSISS